MKRSLSSRWIDSRSADEAREIHRALAFEEEISGADDISDGEIIAEILDHIKVDAETIAAAILLIVLDANAISLENLKESFPETTCNLALEAYQLYQEEKTWLSRLSDDFNESTAKSHHMMLLSMMRDVRVVFILLGHQLLRMRKLSQCDEQEQKRVAREARYIFAPLANRLGIGQLKWELEDFAFRYLNPEKYKNIAKSLEEKRVDREEYMERIVTQLQHALEDAGINANVYGRPKHIYSIWRKMQSKNLKFTDLYDVRAVRVLVEDLSSCYNVLSVVHGMWQFIPEEYDDYIAAPKSNNYQSLHTAVIGPEEKTVEIQIRTHEMHEHAEMGVAAHWRYKEGGKQDSHVEETIEALRDLVENETSNKTKIATTTHSRIYVLSPKGNVVELPKGGTPLDFAYHIHTEVGNKCRGAKVNGKMVPLTTALHSGQTVEIVTAKNAVPSRDWLIPHMGYLKSSRSRAKVKQYFKREFREEHIANGKAMLAKVDHHVSQADYAMLANHFNVQSVDDLYASVGRGDLGPVQVLNVLKQADKPEEDVDSIVRTPAAATGPQKESDIVIQGVDDVMSSLARCCKPMPGESVVGFITRGRGVSIHRADCINLANLKNAHPDRIIPVSWGEATTQEYEVDIEIVAMDRSGLLRDVTSVLSNSGVNVLGANTHTDKKTHEAKMRLTLEMNDAAKLGPLLSKLINLRSVLEAYRVK